MKKQTSKKLYLGKIKIASLTNRVNNNLLGAEITHTCSIRVCESNFTGCSNLTNCTGPAVCEVE